ncbi:hypothetical protein [Mycoplasmopsis cynos]|nr:hypothetical protein [Mycoplasmopsis cynos]UWV92999.1 hypothetical protein NWE57_03230 [Mycoplasmopsis cynos]
MRKNKNNTRILRHHNDEIDPKKEGLRYKRFLEKFKYWKWFFRK